MLDLTEMNEATIDDMIDRLEEIKRESWDDYNRYRSNGAIVDRFADGNIAHALSEIAEGAGAITRAFKRYRNGVCLYGNATDELVKFEKLDSEAREVMRRDMEREIYKREDNQT